MFGRSEIHLIILCKFQGLGFKSNNGYGQQVQPDFTDSFNGADLNKQMQQRIVLPTVKTVGGGFGQQQQLDQSAVSASLK